MIIDVHGHTNGAARLGGYKASLLAGRGSGGKGNTSIPDEQVAGAIKHHLEGTLDKVGTDMQFLSPRPFQLMHSERPTKIVHWYCEMANNAVATTVKLAPTRYQGIAALPQSPSEPITSTFDEIDRCMDQGFIGIMINPDPNEGNGEPFPGMGDEYWYPLYEKMVKENIPAAIHGAGCRDEWDTYSSYFITTETRCMISMIQSKTMEHFPDLKIVVSHGGGAVPYQIGRYITFFGKQDIDFEAEFKKFYFDAGLYNQEGLDLLFKIAGSDRCMFATENPGTGTYKDPKTGLMMDDTKPMIEAIEWLSAQDKKNIFEDVAKKVFSRLK